MRKIFILFIAIFLASCASQRVEYLPSELKTDTIYKSINKVDSVYRIDSVFVNQYVKGDTVYKEKVKVKFKESVKIKTDTIYRCKIDSVRIQVPVEKKLTSWEHTKMTMGGIFMSLISVCLGLVLLYAFIRRFTR